MKRRHLRVRVLRARRSVARAIDAKLPLLTGGVAFIALSAGIASAFGSDRAGAHIVPRKAPPAPIHASFLRASNPFELGAVAVPVRAIAATNGPFGTTPLGAPGMLGPNMVVPKIMPGGALPPGMSPPGVIAPSLPQPNMRTSIVVGVVVGPKTYALVNGPKGYQTLQVGDGMNGSVIEDIEISGVTLKDGQVVRAAASDFSFEKPLAQGVPVNNGPQSGMAPSPADIQRGTNALPSSGSAPAITAAPQAPPMGNAAAPVATNAPAYNMNSQTPAPPYQR